MSQFVFIIMIFLATAITEFFTYKLIRLIDRKERRKLQKWETSYIEELEKKVKEYDRIRNDNIDPDQDIL